MKKKDLPRCCEQPSLGCWYQLDEPHEIDINVSRCFNCGFSFQARGEDVEEIVNYGKLDPKKITNSK